MSESTVDMTDRVVLVTGGTGGIGKETATALARMGATTILVGRNEERAAYSSVCAATAPELVGMTGLYLDPTGNPDSSSSVSWDEGLATELWDVLADLTDVESYSEPAGITTEEAAV